MNWLRIAAVVVAASSAVPGLAHGERGGGVIERASLVTVEGTVGAVERITVENGASLEVVRVEPDSSGAPALSIALAPHATLEQIGFEVRPGDRLRAKVFLSGDSDDVPVLAHKVLNLTRGSIVRLRTLTRIPLWDQQGRWQGGPCRTQHGGPRHRGGGNR